MHIPPQNMEIERSYSQVLAGGNRTLAITSANPGEGVTSIALALVQRNLLAGHSTLLVDLNLYRPSIDGLLRLGQQPEEAELLEAPQLVTTQEYPLALTGITAPIRREVVMQLRRPGVLEQCITEWRRGYDSIIFDTSPINRINANNIPPERVAAACDGVLLVVHAGHTTEAMVATATDKLKTTQAELLGCIFNDRDNPPLRSELLREIKRLEPRLGSIARHMGNWIQNNHLLAMEI